MLMVISPAKTLDFETQPTTSEHSTPDFLDDSAELIEQLRALSPHKVSELMKISDKLGALNFDRYLSWDKHFTPDNAKQALLAFKGDVYTGLDAQSMSVADLQWAQSHLRILSGLYGLLRPLDLMQPYRLEMGTRLGNDRGKDLYQFWGGKITDQLNHLQADEKLPVLVNLASNEYFKSVQTKKLGAEIITPVFKGWKGDKYKIISFYAKKARGLMVAYIIRKRLTDVEQIKNFDSAGYVYNPAMSSASEWVFTREQAAT
ncbi:MAG: peroxide stress protein YaaA [Gammaproteobacteria bacterium]|nr:peroxide stress protein YaaA [Gammaproteobacteria bacterium]MBQ0839296.1 peroxide stress protein YaaA [Gammaproteobacteria bacterium]